MSCNSVLISMSCIVIGLCDAVDFRREMKDVFERTNTLISRSYEVKSITCYSFGVRHSCEKFCTLSFSQVGYTAYRTYQK